MPTPPLTVTIVYDTLDAVARKSGPESSKGKVEKLANLITDANPLEARYVMRTVTRRLRVGIGDMTVCKVGSGFTDENLESMPKMFKVHLLPHKHSMVDSILKADLWFETASIIEVIGGEITLSPIHSCAFNKMREGSELTIRFPRFKGRWRPDKSPEDSTSVEEIVEMYKSQLKKISSE